MATCLIFSLHTYTLQYGLPLLQLPHPASVVLVFLHSELPLEEGLCTY